MAENETAEWSGDQIPWQPPNRKPTWTPWTPPPAYETDSFDAWLTANGAEERDRARDAAIRKSATDAGDGAR